MLNRVLVFAACVCSLQAADVLVEAADNLQLIELDPNRLEVRIQQWTGIIFTTSSIALGAMAYSGQASDVLNPGHLTRAPTTQPIASPASLCALAACYTKCAAMEMGCPADDSCLRNGVATHTREIKSICFHTRTASTECGHCVGTKTSHIAYCKDLPSCKNQLYQAILSALPTQPQVPQTETCTEAK
jgi:hypothetical protein